MALARPVHRGKPVIPLVPSYVAQPENYKIKSRCQGLFSEKYGIDDIFCRDGEDTTKQRARGVLECGIGSNLGYITGGRLKPAHRNGPSFSGG